MTSLETLEISLSWGLRLQVLKASERDHNDLPVYYCKIRGVAHRLPLMDDLAAALIKGFSADLEPRWGLLLLRVLTATEWNSVDAGEKRLHFRRFCSRTIGGDAVATLQ